MMIKFTKIALSVTSAFLSSAAMSAPAFYTGYNDFNFVAYENQYRASSLCTAATCEADTIPGGTGGPAGGYQRVKNVAGNVDEGDIFVGVFSTTKINSALLVNEELTGYFVHEVDSFTVPDPMDPLQVNINLKAAAVDPFGKLAAGEVFAFWLESAPSVANIFDVTNVTIADSIFRATNGNKWAGLTLAGVTNPYLYTTSDLAEPAGESTEKAFFGLNVINKGLPYYTLGALNPVNDPDEAYVGGVATGSLPHLCSAADIAAGKSCTDFFGSAEVELNNAFNSPNVNTKSPWFFQVNDPVVLDQAVPEPATIALTGLALLALGAIRRKRAA